MKAPKEVIEYLDEAVQPRAAHEMVYTLLSEGAVLDAGDIDDFNPVSDWVYTTGTVEESKMRELAVINHLFGTERLQPERETRYYVVKEGGRIQLGIDDVPELLSGHQMLEYEFGMTKEQAVGYAELFGGEPKEIK